MNEYDHKKIERKWQKVWKETGLYKTKEMKKTNTPPAKNGSAPLAREESATSVRDKGLRIKDSKSYVLDMFPYPSGDGLHVGHPKGYIATDVYSRHKKMLGYSILHPIGWDAFGLPAENYAIKNKVHPAVAVKKNIKRFKSQLERIGFNYDWEREINTTDPSYYKWTQWIFLQMYKAGLAFQSHEPINWCPSCQTGLANEDLENGRCERCGSVVEKKAIPQWVLRITKYADRLLSGLDALDWPEYIKESQRNWIGRSEGAIIKFEIRSTKSETNSKSEIQNSKQKVEIFTTRADTLFGATYLVLAPEHPFVQQLLSSSRRSSSEVVVDYRGTSLDSRLRGNDNLLENSEEIEKYLADTKQKTEIERTAEGKEKTGVELKGIRAINPANHEEIPVWIADYVLADYGTGAVMAVPAHDERDFQFASKHHISVKMVVCPDYPAPTCPVLDTAYVDEGHLVDSGKFNGMTSKEAKRVITEFVGGKLVVKYKLRDWVFSRQRYWGEPIPLIHCPKCGVVPVPERELPVKLPNVKSYEPAGTGESPLADIASFVNTKCPKCKGPAKRETNTMPQWAGSCWYYLAYIMRGISNFQFPISKYRKAFEKWLPVDMYVGGAEHATRHLIYARFWHKFLFDIGVVGTDEPFQRLQNVGLILASDGRKMSKRFANVVNPDEIVDRFGADSLRVYEMFMGPFNQAIAWNTDSLVGARRFLERVWKLRLKIKDSRLKKEVGQLKSDNLNLKSLLHQTIKKVGDDIEAFRFNTAVSSLMILLHALEKEQQISPDMYKTVLKLLAPFAPHLAEELWAHFGYKKSIHLEPWPAYDEKIAESAPITIIVQVNGKTRGSFTAVRGDEQELLKATASSLPSVKKRTDGRVVQRTIVVPDRLVNIVVQE